MLSFGYEIVCYPKDELPEITNRKWGYTTIADAYFVGVLDATALNIAHHRLGYDCTVRLKYGEPPVPGFDWDCNVKLTPDKWKQLKAEVCDRLKQTQQKVVRLETLGQ